MNASRLALVLALAVGLAGKPLATGAEQTSKVPRIEALVVATAAYPPVEGFRQGLRELGYVEGGNIVVAYRYAEGKTDRYGALAAEVVRLKPDVIVVWGTELALAVRRATPTIPIVFALADRPIEMGLVATLARPGGNVTGLTTLSFELSAKRLELLEETLPRLTRVAVLYGPDPRVAPTLNAMAVAARPLGIRLQPLEARGPQDFDRVSPRSRGRGRARSSCCRPPSSPRTGRGSETSR